MIESWKLSKSSFVCLRCGAEFRQAQPFFSALIEQPPDFTRQDFCMACWEQAPKQDAFCFWKSRRLANDRRPKVDVEVVFDLFNNLENAEGSEKREMRFVLALYLARRKALRFLSVKREDDRELLQFCRPRLREVFSVEDPNLTEEQINLTTQKIKELFQSDT
jgi:hypothetical protein